MIVNIMAHCLLSHLLSEDATLKQPNPCLSLRNEAKSDAGKAEGSCMEVEDAELYPNASHGASQTLQPARGEHGTEVLDAGTGTAWRGRGGKLWHQAVCPGSSSSQRRPPKSSTFNRAQLFSKDRINLICVSNWDWLDHFSRNKAKRRPGN